MRISSGSAQACRAPHPEVRRLVVEGAVARERVGGEPLGEVAHADGGDGVGEVAGEGVLAQPVAGDVVVVTRSRGSGAGRVPWAS